MGQPSWMRPPVEYRRVMDPAEKMARLEADQFSDIQAGRAPRQLRDGPAPAPILRLGPLPLQLLRLLWQAAAPLTAVELTAHVGAPPLRVAAALNVLARNGLVLALRGDARGLRYWPRGRPARRR